MVNPLNIFKIFWPPWWKEKLQRPPPEPIKPTAPKGEESTEKILSYGRRLAKVPIKVEVLYDGFSEIVNAKIEDEHWLKYTTADGRKHRKKILHCPNITEEARGILFLKRRVRSMKFYIGYESEATHDPKATQYNIPALENAIKITNTICKGDILRAAADQVKVKPTWMEYIPWIVVALISLVAILTNAGVV